MGFRDDVTRIGDLVSKIRTMEMVRREIHRAVKASKLDGVKVFDSESGCSVTARSRRYDVVVQASEDDLKNLIASLKKTLPDAKVDRLVKGVLGVKTARRVKHDKGSSGRDS